MKTPFWTIIKAEILNIFVTTTQRGLGRGKETVWSYGCLISVTMQYIPMTVRMLAEAGVDSGVWCTWCGAGMVDTWTQDLGWRGKAAAALGNSQRWTHELAIVNKDYSY